MTSSLVGSEMCIRDRAWQALQKNIEDFRQMVDQWKMEQQPAPETNPPNCLLYTSDAADDM
eukprot:2693465-Prorocentrum_lima.AAC.1